MRIKSKIFFAVMLLCICAGLCIACIGCSSEKEHEHSYVWTTVVAPTCQSEGSAQGECACGDKTTKVLPQTEHDFQLVQNPAPTCLSGGKQMQKCANCGATKDIVNLPPTGHKWNEGVIEYDADCENAGSKVCQCEYCGISQTFVIQPKGHNYQTVQDPAPTCLSGGKQMQKCSNCGATKDIVNLPPTGHKWSEGVIERDADCENAGSKVCQCEYCGISQTFVIQPKGHNYQTVQDPAPTCLSGGKQMQKCSNCGATKDIVNLPPTGHKWNEGVIEYDADCENAGSKVCQCEYCGESQTFVIQPKGHLIDENVWDIDKSPTFLEEGIKSHHCKREGCKYKTGETVIEKYVPSDPQVTYKIKLIKTNGENLPSSTSPTIAVTDGEGRQYGSANAVEYSVTLPSDRVFYVSVTFPVPEGTYDLPSGYLAVENYAIMPDKTAVNIKVAAEPLKYTTNAHARYKLGSVIMDDKLTILGKTQSGDYTTSFGELLKRYKGIFVNLYFNSCSACNYELPDFISAYNSTSAYGEKYSDEIAVVMINSSDNNDAIRRKKTDKDIPMMMAAHDVWLTSYFFVLSNQAYPTSVWIDCEGVVVGSVTKALGKSAFTGYFDLLLDRYYKIKEKQRPQDKTLPAADVSEVYFTEQRKRRVA